MRPIAILPLALLASCAGAYRPVQFPPRPYPAEITVADDEALCAAGYVSLGSFEAAITKGTDSATELRRQAGARGGDLVRIVKRDVPTTETLTETECNRFSAPSIFIYSAPMLLQVWMSWPQCIPDPPKV